MSGLSADPEPDAGHVLIAEDEARITALLERGLRAAGFRTSVAMTGPQALSAASGSDVDLVILDLGLPELDGLDVLRALRRGGSALPVLVLTARDHVRDTVAGLELGADDYMTKPFAFAELLARVRARLRTSTTPAASLRHEHLELDLHRRTLSAGGTPVELTAREFALLQAFIRRPGQVLSRAHLLQQAWHSGHDPGTNVVDVYVGYVRRKLRRAQSDPDRAAVETVHGQGYRLIVPPR